MTKILELVNTGMKSSAEVGTFGFKNDGVEYFVGDLVLFTNKDEHTDIGIVAKHSFNGDIRVCGAFNENPTNLELRKIVPFHLVTNEILKMHHWINHMELREVEVKEMTLKQVENALGYKIKIVE